VAAVGTNPWLTRLLFARLVADPASITEKDIALVQRQFTLAQFTPAFASWLEQLLLLQTPADNALLDYLDATGIPILFVWGTKDPLTPFAQALWLRERLSRATLVTIPDVGHIPQLEAYAQVRDAVAQFVRKQAS
jgi:pimeloyl-ACP methyl ester carboxylesterase